MYIIIHVHVHVHVYRVRLLGCIWVAGLSFYLTSLITCTCTCMYIHGIV